MESDTFHLLCDTQSFTVIEKSGKSYAMTRSNSQNHMFKKYTKLRLFFYKFEL